MKGKLTKAMLRRRNRRFYAIYFAVVAVVLVGVFIGSRYLLDELREYEDTRNIYTAREVFSRFENGDYEALFAYESGYDADDQALYAQAMRDLAAGGTLELVPQSTTKNGEYTVTLNGNRFAKFTISPVEGQTSPKGYAIWELTSVTALSLPTTSWQIRAREDYTVMSNGKPLTDSDKTQSGLTVAAAEHLPQGTAPTECVYTVTSAFGEPVFTCTDHQGRDVTLTPDENGVLVAGVNYDEIDDETRTYITKTAKCLALYTSDDQDIYEMNKYLLPDSKAHAAIKGLETGWFTLHTSYRFENTTVENVQFYGDDIMACDVKLTFIIVVKKNNEEKSYPMHYTFYFKKSGEKWLLYEFVSQ